MHWRRKWQPTPVFSPGESHGRRSLAGYSPEGRKESDRTERLHFHFSLFQLKTKEDVEGSGFGLCNGSDEIHMEIEKQSIDKQMFVVPC